MVKQMTVYIMKAAKVAVVSVSAFVLVAGSLLCCCLTKSAHASAESVKVSSHCHPSKSDQQKASHSKNCDCCKIKGNYSDSVLKVFEAVPLLVKSWHVFVSDTWAQALAHRSSVYLACAGPPPQRSSLPMYLQFSNLRL